MAQVAVFPYSHRPSILPRLLRCIGISSNRIAIISPLVSATLSFCRSSSIPIRHSRLISPASITYDGPRARISALLHLRSGTASTSLDLLQSLVCSYALFAGARRHRRPSTGSTSSCPVSSCGGGVTRRQSPSPVATSC